MRKEQAIDRLERLKAEIPAVSKTLSPRHVDFMRWRPKIENAIRYIFPENTSYSTQLENIKFYPTSVDIISGVPNAAARAFRAGMEEADVLLHVMIDHVTEYWPETGSVQHGQSNELIEASAESTQDALKTVFVVHGRNGAIRDAMFAFLRAIGLKPLEWSEAVALTKESSPYIGKVLDAAFFAAKAVVVLMTPDDEARLLTQFHAEDEVDHERKLTGQARPNVLFEAGMAMGRKADRTILVEIGKIRPFSDIGGRHTVKFDGSSEQRKALATRLKTAGCSVDLSGDAWLKEGVFDIDLPKKSSQNEEKELSLPRRVERRRSDLRVAIGPIKIANPTMTEDANRILGHLFAINGGSINQIREKLFHSSIALNIVQESCELLQQRGFVEQGNFDGTNAIQFCITAKGRNHYVSRDR